MAQIESLIELPPRLCEVIIVHVVAAFVVADVNTPRLRHHVRSYTLLLVIFKELEEAIARLELVQCELHFDDLQC